MRNIVLALVLCFGPAHADVIAQAEDRSGRKVILHDTPCKGEPGQFVELMAPNGQLMFVGCWRPGDGVVLIRWSDGDESVVPAQVFQKAPGA